jgi:outer membrane protein assembly factor BamB
MGMLADRAEYVIGVDTHRDSHTIAVCTSTGAVIWETTVDADASGYERLLRFGVSRHRAAVCGRSRGRAASVPG